MKQEELNDLIIKYLDGNATEQEIELVDIWYEGFETKPGLIAELDEEALKAAVEKSFETFQAKLHVPSKC